MGKNLQIFSWFRSRYVQRFMGGWWVWCEGYGRVWYIKKKVVKRALRRGLNESCEWRGFGEIKKSLKKSQKLSNVFGGCWIFVSFLSTYKRWPKVELLYTKNMVMKRAFKQATNDVYKAHGSREISKSLRNVTFFREIFWMYLLIAGRWTVDWSRIMCFQNAYRMPLQTRPQRT